MSTDKTSEAIQKAKSSSIVLKILGAIILVPSFLLFIAGLSSRAGILIVAIFMALIGVFFIWVGRRIKRRIKSYYIYAPILDADPKKSIESLASSLGLTTEKIKVDIASMISNGFFPNCYLDTIDNCLKYKTPNSIGETTFLTSSNSTKYVTVVCKGCGATNKILSGTVSECEYCGSHISDN